MKVALLPKKTRGETVNLSLQMPFGEEKSLFGQSTVGTLAGSMLMRGSKQHSRQQIDIEFNRLKATVGVGGNAMGASAWAQTVRSNLVDVLKLFAEVFRQPAFPDSELEQLKNTQLGEIEQGRRDPSARGRLEYRRACVGHCHAH